MERYQGLRTFTFLFTELAAAIQLALDWATAKNRDHSLAFQRN